MGTFKFEKDILARHIRYDLKIFSKVREPLKYIISTLVEKGNSLTIKSLDKKISLSKLKENEGKNYHWSVIKHANVTLLIRRYGKHLTIYTEVQRDGEYPRIERGVFTFLPTYEHLKGAKHDRLMDAMSDKPFMELEKYIKDLFEMLSKNESAINWVDNCYSWKVPDYIKIKIAYVDEQIHSFDDTIFFFEEIDQIHLTLFAQTTMFNKLEEYKTKLNQDTFTLFRQDYIVVEVKNDLKDEYFNGVGLVLQKKLDVKGAKGETKFEDVYSLTRWFYDSVFTEEKK